MSRQTHNLAIETSSRDGSIAVGRDGELLSEAELGVQRRHNVELLPKLAELCGRHDVQPGEIDEVYVSVGPGSFTGLRIGVTAAKMIGRFAGARLVAVPTLDVVVENAPVDHARLAVCLNAKRGQCFTGLYRREAGRWIRQLEPALLTPDELCERAPRPLAVIGDKLPEFDWPGDVTILPRELAVPRATTTWRIGRRMAEAGEFIEARALAPLYVRLPEAEENWRRARGEMTDPARPRFSGART